MTPTDWNSLESTLGRLTNDEKLQLIERVARSLRGASAKALQDKRAALQKLRAELAALPVCNPSDGLSNRDHDRLIYGS